MSRIPIADPPPGIARPPAHLVPLVDELVARGYVLAAPREPHGGFVPSKDGWFCPLTTSIEASDWAASSERSRSLVCSG